jgi:hypothetical protein
MTDTEDKAIDALRKGMADAIEGVSKDYKLINKEYATVAEPLKVLRKFYRGLEDAGADILDERAGVLLRRLTSNAPSGQNLRMAIEDLDAILTGAGKASGVDLRKLQDFSNLIDELYPEVVKKTGLAGQVGLGVKMGGGGITERAIDFVSDLAQASPEYKRKVLKELLGD